MQNSKINLSPVSKSIVELVNNLPEKNLTVKILQSLDFVMPGKWENLVDFNRSIEVITGESDSTTKNEIKDRALELYDDKKNGYQTAIWLYQTADSTDQAAAAAAIADKVGNTFRFIPFLDKLTPKADAIQSLDFKLKIAAELIAFSKLTGTGINPAKFAVALKDNYHKEAFLRMVALVCFDGVLPLGTNFISTIRDDLDKGNDLANNPAFNKLAQLMPAEGKEDFVNESFSATSDWMDNLTKKFGLTREAITKNLGGFIEIADDKLDYLAAFIDASTNFFEHTGIQTVNRFLIKRAYQEFKS